MGFFREIEVEDVKIRQINCVFTYFFRETIIVNGGIGIQENRCVFTDFHREIKVEFSNVSPEPLNIALDFDYRVILSFRSPFLTL